MKTLIMLGTAKVDITPTFPVPLAGFASRKELGAFDDVLHPLHAKIFFFSGPNGQEKKRMALLISADLLWWGPDQVEPMKQKISAMLGLDPASILLHATHTHSGPQTSFRFTPLLGKPDANYIDEMESKVLEGVRTAFARMEPVTIERGKGICRIGIHRRKRVQGRILLAPNKDGPVDPEVNVVRFRGLDGGTRAVLVHFACHPTVSSGNRVSSEFCGVAMAKVERKLGARAVAAYLQGCCGDIAPNVVKDGAFFDGQAEMIDKLGSLLADETIRILRQAMKPLEADTLQVHSITVELPLQKLPTLRELQLNMHKPGVYGEWSRLLLAQPKRLRATLPLEMTFLSISDELSFIAMNAKMVVEYGFAVKRLSGGTALPIGYSNGMIGYVPTAEQIREGGYEADESTLYFALPAPLQPKTEKSSRRA